MKTILIDADRTAYAPSDIRNTMTLGELIEWLESVRDCEEIDEGTPIYLRHDRGNTYGGITKECFSGGKGECGDEIIDLGELAYDPDEEESEDDEE